jgi:hypothetical protein
LAFSSRHFGLQQDGLDQVVEAGLLEGRDLDDLGLAAQAFSATTSCWRAAR